MRKQEYGLRTRGYETNEINYRDAWAKFLGAEGFLEEEEKYKEMEIDDIPIIISEDGWVICIPRSKETRNIIACGKKGTGKSLAIHRLAEEIYWLWGDNVAIMNDIQQETYEWNTPQKNNEWIRMLNEINEKPTSLPLVFVYPHTNTLNLDYYEKQKKINFVEITLPFSEIINNSNEYMELDKTATYFKKLKDILLKCTTIEEIEELINNKFSGKTKESMRLKILSKLNEIYEEEICDIVNPEYPSKLVCGDISGNPFVVLLKLGVIPVFETYDLQYKKYRNQVISYHLEKIYRAVQQDFFENDVYILFDELTHVDVLKSLVKIVSRGRKEGIGLIGATQSYMNIHKDIKDNLDYVFVFKHVNDEQIKSIKNNFNLGKYDLNEIKNLKEMEVVIVSKEKFIAYKEGMKEEIEGPVKGKLIPPISNHYFRGIEK